MKKTFKAWAIKITSDYEAFAGRYYFNTGYIPPSLEGCKTSLFKTRKIAREYNKKIEQYKWYKSRVEKVLIIVESVK